MASERSERLPNILFFHVDNLGPGELSCDSGGFRFKARAAREATIPPARPLDFVPSACRAKALGRRRSRRRVSSY
jgi:hypothetical protein